MKVLEYIIEQGLGKYRFYLDPNFHRIDVSFLIQKILRRENKFESIDFSAQAPDSADAFLIRKTERSGEALYYTVEYYKINKRLE